MSYDDNNIFAKILRNEIPCNKIYEDEFILSFHDMKWPNAMELLGMRCVGPLNPNESPYFPAGSEFSQPRKYKKKKKKPAALTNSSAATPSAPAVTQRPSLDATDVKVQGITAAGLLLRHLVDLTYRHEGKEQA